MRLWLPLTLVCAAVASIVVVYELTVTEGQSSPVGLANLAGLLLVVFGMVAALLILRRAKPP